VGVARRRDPAGALFDEEKEKQKRLVQPLSSAGGLADEVVL